MQMMVLDRSRQLEIDNNELDIRTMLDKLYEESLEVQTALDNRDFLNLQEELFDTIQVCIGILDKLDREGLSLRTGLNKHHKKLVSRGWTSKKMINFTINDWEE